MLGLKLGRGPRVPEVSTIPSVEDFHDLIRHECKLADRHGQRFSLVVLEVGTSDENSTTARHLVRTLYKRFRSIDEVGWFGRNQLGVFLPYTSEKGAFRLAEDIVEMVSQVSPVVPFTIYSYPSNNWPVLPKLDWRQLHPSRLIGRFAARSTIRPSADFRALLALERDRADRNGHIFSLVLLDANKIEGQGISINRVVHALNQRLRLTDVIGWYDEKDIGLLLPYASHENTHKLIERFCEENRTPFKKHCAVYTYPTQWLPGTHADHVSSRREPTSSASANAASALRSMPAAGRAGDSSSTSSSAPRSVESPSSPRSVESPSAPRPVESTPVTTSPRAMDGSSSRPVETASVSTSPRAVLGSAAAVAVEAPFEQEARPQLRAVEGGLEAADLDPESSDAPEPQREFEPFVVRRIPLWKRSMDVVGASVGIVASSWLMVPIAVAIKLTDDGPIIYKGQRAGLGGRPFAFYKFRTMKVGADKLRASLQAQNEREGPVFKMKNDPRVTSLGRFLRKWSLDELPQFFNVLKGDMSLVGPRPPTLDEVAKYYNWHDKRLEIKPGITCLWQVYARHRASFDEWVRLDIQYARSKSFLLDCKILLLTLPAVLSNRGAS